MHSQFYYQPFARTNCYTYSFIPNTVYDWNHLPQDIINICCNMSVFESIVYLLGQQLRDAKIIVIIRQCCINLIKVK